MPLHIKQLKGLAAGYHGDGQQLYLQVTTNGAKSWIFRYQRHGRRREMGLGPLADVGLADARRKAQEARQALAAGKDPIEDRKAQEAARRAAEAHSVTFRQAAEDFVASNEIGWRNSKHRQQWRNTLGLDDKTKRHKRRVAHCDPLHDMPVSAITTEEVLKLLKGIWTSRPETASRIRGRIERVLAYAKVRGLRTGENPAQWRGHLDALLPAKSKVRAVRHQPALPYEDVPALMRELASMDSVSARALRFTILTAARTGEVTGAKWPEIDLEARLWTIPGGRMKAGKVHRVPLSDAAIAIVEKMAETRISEYVFPGWRGGQPLSDMAMLQCLRGLRPGYTVHGFRSSFRDWCAERTAFPSFVAEAALAHAVADRVEAAYRRSELLEKRRSLMDAWADYCG